MLTYHVYAALFDFRAPCPQTKILIFQGTLKARSKITSHFGILSSGCLRSITGARLPVDSDGAGKRKLRIQPKSERQFCEFIFERTLSQ